MTNSTSQLIWDSPDHTPCLESTLQALDSGAREAWAPLSGTGSASSHSRLIADQACRVVADQLGTPTQNVRNTTDFLGTVHHLREIFGRRHWFTSTTERTEVTDQLEASADLPVDSEGLLSWPAHQVVTHLTESDTQPALWLSLSNPEIGTTLSLDELTRAAKAHDIPVVVDLTTFLSRPQTSGLASLAADVFIARSGAWGDPLDSTLVAFTHDCTPPSAVAHFTRVSGQAPAIHTLTAAVALQAAVEHTSHHHRGWYAATEQLRTDLARIPGADIAGHPTERVPHILTASFLYCPGELVMSKLRSRGLEVGSGSACASRHDSPSHVLSACGRLTQGNVRISLPLTATTTDLKHQVPRAVSLISDVVAQVRTEVGAEGLL